MKTHRLFNKIDISILDPSITNVNIENGLHEIERKIPEGLFTEIDIIYVGDFDFLNIEGCCSKFMDNAIYLCKEAYCENDIVYDIVMALGESLEKKYMHLFYDKKAVLNEIKTYWNSEQKDRKDDFAHAVYEYLIEDPIQSRQKMPMFSEILQEIIDETC